MSKRERERGIHLVPGFAEQQQQQDENELLLERMDPIRVAIKIALNFRSRGCREADLQRPGE